MSLIDKIKEHWLVSVLILCAAVAGATWLIEQRLLVEPRDFEIQRLSRLSNASGATPVADQNGPHFALDRVLERTSLSINTALVTSDGRLTIRLDYTYPTLQSASMRVSWGESDAVSVAADLGKRSGIEIPGAKYFIDVTQIRERSVDLEVYRSLN